MKKQLITVVLAACFAAPAIAGDTGVLAVSATVSGTCKFSSIAPMAFGTIDPSAPGPLAQTANLLYKCTKNLAATSFSFDGDATSPASVNITNGTDNIPVALTWTTPVAAGTGFGAGSSDITMTVTGTMVAADYGNASAGLYTRNVNVVVAP